MNFTPPKQNQKKYGTYGRLEIPELQISVPVYKNNGNSQQVCDNKDSAVYLNWGNSFAIADHCTQANFGNLNKVRVGQTIATIDLQTTKNQYRCVKSQVGHIRIASTGNRIFDANWVPVYDQNPGGLTMYTCIERSSPDVMDVRLTYWQPI